MISLIGNENAPVIAGACQLARQCKLEENTITLISRSEFAWNVICDGKLIGSFLSFSRANAFAASVTT